MQALTVTLAPEAAGAVTEQPTAMGYCERCKRVPIQRIDHTPGAFHGAYLCACPDRRPAFPLKRFSS